MFEAPSAAPQPHTLRPYQAEAKRAFYEGVLGGRKKQIVCHPTGCGKTTLLSAIAAQWQGRVVVVAPRREIVHQNAEEMRLMSGEPVDVEMSVERSEGRRLVSASVMTLFSDVRLAKFLAKPPTLLVVDECHHATSSSYRKIIAKILERSPETVVVGFTATPDRTDGKALGTVFEHVTHVLTIEDAVHDGWLVPVKARVAKNVEIDLSKIHTKEGDFKEAELDAAMHEHARGIATGAVEQCGDLKTIVFATRVETAHLIADHISALLGKPGAARAVDGGMTDERSEIMEAFKAGDFQFLVNVGIATEGFNDPRAVAMVNARPTKSRGLFTQMVGRVLRPLKGTVDGRGDAGARRAAIAASEKPFALLVNMAFIAGKHTLVGPEDILGGRYDDEEKALAKKIQAEDQNVAVDEALERAKAFIAEQKAMRAARARAINERARITWGDMDPFAAYGMEHPLADGSDPAEMPAASPQQIDMLRAKGIKPKAGITKVEAQALIRAAMARQAHGLSTLGQISWLTQRGVDGKEARKMSVARANDVMVSIQRNGNTLPANLSHLKAGAP